MKKQPFKIKELFKLGFIELTGSTLDSGDYYRWWQLKKNDSNICITYEYNEDNTFSLGYVEFNEETLKGREITRKDIELLIEIM